MLDFGFFPGYWRTWTINMLIIPYQHVAMPSHFMSGKIHAWLFQGTTPAVHRRLALHQ